MFWPQSNYAHKAVEISMQITGQFIHHKNDKSCLISLAYFLQETMSNTLKTYLFLDLTCISMLRWYLSNISRLKRAYTYLTKLKTTKILVWNFTLSFLLSLLLFSCSSLESFRERTFDGWRFCLGNVLDLSWKTKGIGAKWRESHGQELLSRPNFQIFFYLTPNPMCFGPCLPYLHDCLH